MQHRNEKLYYATVARLLREARTIVQNDQKGTLRELAEKFIKQHG